MSKTLLVIDDAAIIREMIKDTAIDAGWEIAGEATNGQEAIDQYKQLQPDAVTMDVVMPEFDGLYGLRGIRELNPDAKVLMVTAVSQTDLLNEAISSGAADFICKPFDRDNLIKALDVLVS
ncbi:MAG: response regulator [Planctomycetes bacterium]|nr:response regulator [Planctomycetota bacterium]